MKVLIFDGNAKKKHKLRIDNEYIKILINLIIIDFFHP